MPVTPASIWLSCTQPTAICCTSSSAIGETSVPIRYGGSVENRARLVLEVVDAVSQEWSAECIGIRVSPIGSFQNVDNGPERRRRRAVSD